ncbi:dolichyl-phosphate beta-D-mannosyltransferase [candidate division LCP-89 bacterium B3_LCP]|uniref:Dolichyl-phosphate beta-D-mannosyltransferase n=1 Tax=candidate division LCP-89 bacterium B3_LCP TaxID=2012998 RepID=A0A532UU29_UNCL8|nr:MAG: dolichyl-phosphate beta-D-mannosyltransferase [candidate division LCP-89 bacterium B3_LCP]
MPTYDELENISQIIPEVLKQGPQFEILIVDDKSPDGTAGAVKELQDEYKGRLHLMERSGKMGLGTAYVDGFKYALQHDYNYVFEMDADFSHSPDVLPEFLKAIKDVDLVLGSRYVNGVNVINWPLHRLLLSYGASLYTRLITGLPVKDPTGGFKCFSRKVLETINLDKVHSNGYSFQIEMSFRAWNRGFKIKEIPIVFTDRVGGKSKMSSNIVREAIWMVWVLKIKQLFGTL